MDDLDERKRELAVIIGQRLRDVRRARGLSQQALAEGLFSKGYVSSIEHGKIFPSVRALQALAARLDVDLSEFFDPALLAATASHAGDDAEDQARQQNSLALLELRTLATTGAPQALNRLRAIDPDLLTSSERVQLHYAVAVAHLHAGRADAALEALQEATDTLGGDDPATQPALACQLHSLMGEILLARHQGALAVEHLQWTAQQVADPRVAEPLVRLHVLGTLARAYAATGNLPQARTTYEAALGVAQEVTSLDRLAGAFLAVSRQAGDAQDWERARHYGDQAVLLAQVYQAKHRALHAHLEISRLAGPEAAGAAPHLAAALRLARQLGDEASAAVAQARQVEGALAAGDLDAAASAAKEASTSAARSHNRAAQAQVHNAAGLLAEAQGDPAGADAAFQAAIALLADGGDPPLLGQIYFTYARLLTERGQAATAARYYECAYLARSSH